LRVAFDDELREQVDGPTFRKRKQRALERLKRAWRSLHE
jgi:hypothetical protein